MIENRLLAALPGEEKGRLLPDLERVSLNVRGILYDLDDPIRYVYFPNSGVISILTVVDDGLTIEAGTVGREGVVGIPVFLGIDTSINRAVVQVAGEAMRMKAEAFKEAARRSGLFHDLLQLYTYALLTQISLSVACNRFHGVEKRLARWLLMMNDRAGVDEFQLTQEFIARMLGARRPHVTTAARNLQNGGLIRNGRGKIAILNRQGLERVSCDCYISCKKRCGGLFST